MPRSRALAALLAAVGALALAACAPGALDGEPCGGGFEDAAEFGERGDLVEVDRGDRPRATLVQDEPLALEPRQCGADRRTRGVEPRLEPALRDALPRCDVEGQDGCAQVVVELGRLRHGCVVGRVGHGGQA